MPSSRGSSPPRDGTHASHASCTGSIFFTTLPPWLPVLSVPSHVSELLFMLQICTHKHTHRKTNHILFICSSGDRSLSYLNLWLLWIVLLWTIVYGVCLSPQFYFFGVYRSGIAGSYRRVKDTDYNSPGTMGCWHKPFWRRSPLLPLPLP